MSVVSESVVQATFCATVVDEWVELGMAHAVVCPGSRSTPMALALAAREDVRLHVRLDERSAAFVALGLARQLGTPVPILVTSGTAVAELHAAVCEADLSGIPLIVVSADRPPELHDVRAPQTLAQHGIFGTAVRAMVDPGVPTEAMASTWRSIATRVWLTARGGVVDRGPVHLNLHFREPLVAEPGALPPRRGGGWRHEERPAATESATLRSVLAGQSEVLVVAGAGTPVGLAEVLGANGVLVAADPRASQHAPGVLRGLDLIVRSQAAARALRPEVVVLVGEAWASKVLAQQLVAWGASGTTVVSISDRVALDDPAHLLHHRVVVDGAAIQSVLLDALGLIDRVFADAWRAADHAVDQTLGALVDATSDAALTEVSVARAVADQPYEVLVASSSMPVRDLEWFARVIRPTAVVSNRGANGIDGVVSSALGAALAARGPVGVVIGDLAFLHDLSALVDGLGDAQASLTIVVVDNGGGGIFSFLPQASLVSASSFDRLFRTARPIDHAAVVTGLGHAVQEARTHGELVAALESGRATAGITVVRAVVGDADANVELHGRLQAAAVAAVEATLSGA